MPYFITNRIPSAFELSIFTLEIISLAAPLTLDKFILKMKKPMKDAMHKEVNSSDEVSEESEEDKE